MGLAKETIMGGGGRVAKVEIQQKKPLSRVPNTKPPFTVG
nr:truncated omega-6 fatty acid desaturase [Glycine max]